MRAIVAVTGTSLPFAFWAGLGGLGLLGFRFLPQSRDTGGPNEVDLLDKNRAGG